MEPEDRFKELSVAFKQCPDLHIVVSILFVLAVKPEDSFDEVIVRPVPVRKPIPTDPEVIVEDEQTFLLRQQQLLTKVSFLK